jgi:hypothetical protein
VERNEEATANEISSLRTQLIALQLNQLKYQQESKDLMEKVNQLLAERRENKQAFVSSS